VQPDDSLLQLLEVANAMVYSLDDVFLESLLLDFLRSKLVSHGLSFVLETTLPHSQIFDDQ